MMPSVKNEIPDQLALTAKPPMKSFRRIYSLEAFDVNQKQKPSLCKVC